MATQTPRPATAAPVSPLSLWPRRTPGLANTPLPPPGAIALLPFAANPAPLLKLHRAGCKVIAANADPLPMLALNARLTPLKPTSLAAAFTRLRDTLKRGQSLAEHLSNLYQTTCPTCRAPTPADYFVWRKKAADPELKWVACPACDFNSLTPATPDDLARLDAVPTRGLHYHFLLERTAAPADAARPDMEWLHELYPPRALYAIAEIIMKLKAAFGDETTRRVFKAILLNCLLPAAGLFDRLRPPRLPSQLRPPTQFLERNVWSLFQAEVSAWRAPATAPPLTNDPGELRRRHRATVCLFPHSAAHLQSHLPAESVSLVLAAPPPANPVAWSLSVLWSGWLLGLQAARPRHGLLAQPWPDWDWYRQALCAVMQPLRPALKPDAVWVFDFEAADPRHAPAVTLAALKAGYRAIDWRIAGTRHRLTLAPTPPDPVSPAGPERIKAAVRQQSRAAVDALLRQRGQPASGEQLFLAAWRALLFSGLLAQTLAALPGRQVLPWLSEQINRAIQPS